MQCSTAASLIALALAAMHTPGANAAPAGTSPISFEAGARLRYEQVDDDLFASNAQATTLRVRAGLRWTIKPQFDAYAEGEGVAALDDRYNSTANGRTSYPAVVDPQGAELNQAWVRWHRKDDAVQLGRQRLQFDNQRWVGNSGWRQNEQTFDALSLQYAASPELVLRYAAIDRVHRINGDHAIDPLARERDLSAHLLNASWGKGAQRVTGYGYLVEDQDVARASTATWGVRYALASTAERIWGITLEAARQSDYADNPLQFSHDYWLVEPTVNVHGVQLRGGWEHLGGNGTHALQTPLATLHAFNGWADRFLTTPAAGLEDRYVAAGGKLMASRAKGALEWQGAWHDYRSDAGDRRYGSEFDASLGVPLAKGLKGLVKVAAYRAEGFSADATKAWLQLEWTPAPYPR